MKWTSFTLHTINEATDIISCTLSELGVTGIEIEDNVPLTEDEKKQMFVDILPDPVSTDNKAIIRFYRDSTDDVDAFVLSVKEALSELSEFMDIGEGTIEVSETADKDWINNWKEFFHTFRVTDRMVIKPTWEDMSSYDGYKENDIVISIDPGTAFGTGSHDTTKLCIGALEKYVQPGMDIFDVGCGSGILSIAAVKYGAGHALGIDIDKYAIPSTIENRDINGIGEDRFEIMCGNLLDETDAEAAKIEKGKYDIAVANILADVIIPLSAIIGEYIKPGGLFISSGIIDTAAEGVREAIEAAEFEILETTTSGEWYCFTARKV